jgi:hypothetical protein
MAGHRPGHPRLSLFECLQDVDARHKAGHDDSMLLVNRSFGMQAFNESK